MDIETGNKITIKTSTILSCGLALMVAGLIFGICETIYFGSNWLPQSMAELRCDFITGWLMGAGEFLVLVAIFISIKTILKPK